MRVTFTYQEAEDLRCWQRLVEAGEMFGKTFPKQIDITAQSKQRAQQTVQQFQDWWDEAPECDEGLKTIYGHQPPAEIMVYLNTSSYSMDDEQRGWISLSMMRDSQKKVRTTVIHELGHVLFRHYWSDFCFKLGCSQDDIEDLKEVVTVIHNGVFNNVEDQGYHVHASLRALALDTWNQTHTLERVVQEVVQHMKEQTN